jgi:hypothetical protein
MDASWEFLGHHTPNKAGAKSPDRLMRGLKMDPGALGDFAGESEFHFP